ncbi:MAG: Wzz/FepE/Etk N-terminal domain-containing protein, partial [Ramlibacter sp.]
MSLHQFFSILRARIGVVVLVMLTAMALAVGWAKLRSATYTARAPVLVDLRTDPVGATPLQSMVTPGYMSTQIDIAKSEWVAKKVATLLPADQEPMLRLREEAQKKPSPQLWIAHELATGLEVKPARESNIVTIAWTGRTADEAARVANAFAQAYIATNLELKTIPAKKYADWFEEKVKEARDKLETAQQKLSAYQEKAGIVSSDERGDYETARLTELSNQLLMAQGGHRRGASGDTSPGVMASPLVNNMRADVAKLESKVQEASATMGSNHPSMQRMRAELAELRSRLASESARVGSASAAAGDASRARERELQQAVAAQKARVIATNKQRGELNVLQREVESAQKAFETVSASAAESRLQSKATQNNVVFLGSATEPLEKSGPSGRQAVMIAGVGGLLIGLALAFLLELLNRRVRSVDDLSMVTNLPILASVPASAAAFKPLRIAHESQRRLALASRG